MKSPIKAWTHPSVRRLAKEGDPVELIIRRARVLAAKAFDAGWSGPPFDPFRLADYLGIEVLPKHAVRDARICNKGSKFIVEYNPDRSTARIRYSLAHEIAHTLFEDCGEQVRYRQARETAEGDDWQLEMLCNIAAAELLMPIGELPDSNLEVPSIDQVIDLRKKFQVSTEAVLLRIAHLAERPLAAFCASRTTTGRGAGRYRLDYAVPSLAWQYPLRPQQLLPRDTVVSSCTAIGYTAKGGEVWFSRVPVHVECVGLPPYPGSHSPRVAGVLRSTTDKQMKRPGITYLQGDARRPGKRPAVIVQIVNDRARTWGGRGFAAALRETWPEAHDAYREWRSARRGVLLGSVHLLELERGLWLASIVAQHGYGPSPRPRIRYLAMQKGMSEVALLAKEKDASIHIPRLGCGEGGADWAIVSELVRSEWVQNGLEVTVYDLPGQSEPKRSQGALELGSPS